MSSAQFVSKRNSNFLSFLALRVRGRTHLGPAEEAPLDEERGLRTGSEHQEAVGLLAQCGVVVLCVGEQKSGSRQGSNGFAAPRLVHFMRFRALFRTDSSESSCVES